MIMKLLKYILLILFLLIVTAGGCVFYAFKIEPYRLKVNDYDLNEKQDGMKDIKIVQISDLHIKEDFTHENLAKVVKRVNAQAPDIVLFTGDLYDNYAKYHDDDNIIAQLQKINATYGKLAIWGNRDHGGGASRQYANIMESAGFTLLKNENLTITLEKGGQIFFTALDDSLLGAPSMPDDRGSSGAVLKMLLTHEPDAAENYLENGYDMILSGHSHGGQINIPFLPFLNEIAVASSALSSKYSGGMYTPGADTKTRLYVNTGIGTTHISARFGVVPEIAVFHLYN